MAKDNLSDRIDDLDNIDHYAYEVYTQRPYPGAPSWAGSGRLHPAVQDYMVDLARSQAARLNAQERAKNALTRPDDREMTWQRGMPMDYPQKRR